MEADSEPSIQELDSCVATLRKLRKILPDVDNEGDERESLRALREQTERHVDDTIDYVSGWADGLRERSGGP